MSYYTLEKDSKTLNLREEITDPEVIRGIEAILKMAFAQKKSDRVYILDSDGPLLLPFIGQFYKNRYYVSGIGFIRIFENTNQTN